ncbi:MAG TPA: NUDIX hydrolase [Chloroflexota bacterium]|nr:NUDIX hydrolase [Chloroflexota bacterium]
MKFCPHCAAPLDLQFIAGLDRPHCASCGFIHYEDPKLVAVSVIAIDQKLVLGRRAINPGRGFWSFPSGYVNRGESVEAAAVREVREETQLIVEVDRLLGLYSETSNPVVLAVYVAHAVGGCLAAGDEVTEVGLFRPSALPDLAFPSDRRILRDWHEFVGMPFPASISG